MKTDHRIKGTLLIALVATIVGPDDVRAGTYLMRSCNVPSERSAPASPWTWLYTSAEVYANDECASGGGFGLNAGSTPQGKTAAVHLAVPRDGPRGAITIRRVRLWMIARLSASGGNMFVNFSGGTGSQVVHQDLFGPPGGSTLTEPYVSPLMPEGSSVAFVGLACTGGTCVPASPNPLEIRGAEVTLSESVAPAATVVGGPPLDGSTQSGVVPLGYTATDGESGIAEVSVLLGSTVVGLHDFRSECLHMDFAACATVREGKLMVDTRKVADGSYPLALRVTDAAGNRETIPASAINVANGAATPNNGQGATRSAKLTAAFAGRRGLTATVRYYGGLTIRGRLTTASGRPIGRAKLEIVETPVGTGGRAATRTATTRTDGRFTYVVRRRGMSRNLRVRYRSNLNNPSIAASRSLGVRVSAAGTLRVALRGVRVTYRGRILSGPIPRGGKRVYIEGRAAGGRWTRFATRRTNSAGRFSGRYRLRVRRPGVRLQFRLRIPRQSNYPYGVGVGNPVSRTVH